MNTIETKRLILRSFVIEDAQDVYNNWTSDERVAATCRWYAHKTVSDTQSYLNDFCINKQDCWAITLKGDEQAIGCIDVVGEEDGAVEIGYVLGYAYWNKGYMSEALKGVIDFLFAQGQTRIIAKHYVRNPASGKVMEKAGMSLYQEAMLPSKFGSDDTEVGRCYEIIQEK